jgi:hypothetical protein
MMGLGFNGCFVTSTPCLNESHGYGFASSMGYSRSDLVGLLVYDGMCIYPRHQCYITGPFGQHQPAGNELISRVEHMRQTMTYMYRKYIFA